MMIRKSKPAFAVSFFLAAASAYAQTPAVESPALEIAPASFVDSATLTSCRGLARGAPGTRIEPETLQRLQHDCASQLLRGADPRAVELRGGVYAAGLDRALLVRSNGDHGANERTLFGDQTRLNKIVAVRVDPAHHEVIALDHGGAYSVLTFPDSLSGNVGPARIFPIESEGDFTSLAVDEKTDRIFVAAPGKVLVYARKSNAAATLPARKISPASVIEGSATQIGEIVDLAVNTRRGQLLILNRSASGVASLLIFAQTANGDHAPAHVYRNDPLLTPAVRLVVEGAQQRLRVIDGTGRKAYLPLADLPR